MEAYTELRFEAGPGLRRAGVAYVRAAVGGETGAPLTRDRSGARGQRLEMELGFLLRASGKRQPIPFARRNGRVCEALLRHLLAGVRELRAEAPALFAGRNVYVSLIAVEPQASAQERHSDAPDRAKGSYATIIVPLTAHQDQGTTEFMLGGAARTPAPGRAYAFDGQVAHRGGANLSRGWRCAVCVVVCKGSDPNRLAGGSRSWADHLVNA